MILTHIKTALVDFDGTLVDSNDCWVEAYQLLCKQRKVQPSTKIINAFSEITFDKWQDLILEQFGKCNEELLDCAKLTYAQRTPKESVLSVVRSLSAGCKISIITREPNELVRNWLAHYTIGVFREVITSGDERKDVTYYAQPQLLLIDDNYKHCMAAKLANTTVIGINDHHTEKEKAQMRKVCDLYIED